MARLLSIIFVHCVFISFRLFSCFLLCRSLSSYSFYFRLCFFLDFLFCAFASILLFRVIVYLDPLLFYFFKRQFFSLPFYTTILLLFSYSLLICQLFCHPTQYKRFSENIASRDSTLKKYLIPCLSYSSILFPVCMGSSLQFFINFSTLFFTLVCID